MQLYMALSELPGKKMIVNCAATPDKLLCSEVFGHVKGAFTGAIEKRDGEYATCKDGILALDEIGDAPPRFQAMILRVLEGGGYFPWDQIKRTIQMP